MQAGRRLQPQQSERKRIGTLKCLKITGILQSIYCLCWVISIVFLALGDTTGMDLLTGIGIVICYLCMINPIGMISFALNLREYLADCKLPEEKARIGAKAVWIFLWLIITTAFWLFGGGAFVGFTGGV